MWYEGLRPNFSPKYYIGRNKQRKKDILKNEAILILLLQVLGRLRRIE